MLPDAPCPGCTVGHKDNVQRVQLVHHVFWLWMAVTFQELLGNTGQRMKLTAVCPSLQGFPTLRGPCNLGRQESA